MKKETLAKRHYPLIEEENRVEYMNKLMLSTNISSSQTLELVYLLRGYFNVYN